MTYEKLNRAQSWKVFDAAAQRILHLSGEEVARLWDAGELSDNDSPELMQVIMLRPGGR